MSDDLAEVRSLMQEMVLVLNELAGNIDRLLDRCEALLGGPNNAGDGDASS